MDRVVWYRAAESGGDPALAPAFAAAFLGGGCVTGLTGLAYRDLLTPIPAGLAMCLGMLMLLVGLALLFLLRRNAMFALADDDGILVRMGHGGRRRIPWTEIVRVIRSRPFEGSPDAKVHILWRPRRRVVLPPGEGQDDLYDLARSVLDGAKTRTRRGDERVPSGPEPAPAASGHSPYPVVLWALLNVGAMVAAGVFVTLSRERAGTAETALFVAIAFLLWFPLSRFPPSAGSGVTRAHAGPEGLTYQTVLWGTRTIPWEQLVAARVSVVGQVGSRAYRLLEVFGRNAGLLLMPVPRNAEFLACIDYHLGTHVTEALAAMSANRQAKRKG